MANLLLLFNHNLTEAQQEDAKHDLKVEDILLPPAEIGLLWSQLPADAQSLLPLLVPVQQWLTDTAQQGDFILIQGDFGACYIMAKFCFSNGLIPIYATTRRQAREKHQQDGSVLIQHTFNHVCYRRYDS